MRAIEAHEVRCRAEMESAYTAWKEAQSKRVEGDDVSERMANRMHREYGEALEAWHDSSKKLLEYDSKVAPARREGEKVPVDDVKEWFAQYELSIDLAIEALIKADAQSAALCDSPEAFYKLHAENYRAAKRNALDQAIQNGVIPRWML